MNSSLLDKLCELYISVNYSPNVDKFAIVSSLRNEGWNTLMWSNRNPRSYSQHRKICKWCKERFGAPYTLNNFSGKWMHFRNKNGPDTAEYVLAFEYEADYTWFLLNWDDELISLR